VRRSLRRAGRAVPLLLTAALASPGAALGAAKGFEVLAHLSQSDGAEKIVRVSDFRFVYYERRFVHRAPGIGRPPTLEVKDLPHEIHSLQNEELDRLRFGKIRALTLSYQEEAGKRVLHLVAIRKQRRSSIVDWPAFSLRNVSSARLPHFRGRIEGRTVDFPLPPLVESTPPPDSVILGVDFEFPGQTPHHKWF